LNARHLQTRPANENHDSDKNRAHEIASTRRGPGQPRPASQQDDAGDSKTQRRHRARIEPGRNQLEHGIGCRPAAIHYDEQKKMRWFHERRWKLKSTFIVDLIMAANGAAANEKWKMESEANENRLRQQLRSGDRPQIL
jgi:hypothetical protein